MSLVKKPAGISKPAGLKKPAVKKPPVAKPLEAKQPEEEKVIEIPVVVEEVEEVAPELLEKMIEEENDKLEEQDAIEEPVVEQPVVVEEKPKAKKKTSSKKKKEEPKEEVVQDVQENLPQMSLDNAVERMASDVNISLPEWDEAKQEIQDKLKALTIDPDMNPATMRTLVGELDDMLTDLRFMQTEMETQVEALNEQVEYIRLTNSKGTNSEERKAAGYQALMNYKKDPEDEEVINLIQYQVFMNGKLNFLNKAIETVKDRKQLLVTFSAMLKIESTF